MRPTIDEVMIPFTEQEPPENKDLLVKYPLSNNEEDGSMYSIFHFCKKGDVMLHEYRPSCNTKANNAADKVIQWAVEWPTFDTISKEELCQLTERFMINEDDYTEADEDCYYLYDVERESSRSKWRKMNLDLNTTQYAVLE